MLGGSDTETGHAASELLRLWAPNTAGGCASSAARGVGQRGAGIGAERGAVFCAAGEGLSMSGMGFAKAAGLGDPPKAGRPVGSAGLGKGLPFDDRASAEGTA